ncbi:potassium channel family protein [Couchioplanes caeruleus]|uniref:potassium channel family protein n=1 Tax=Couchioplanes caeruleus TaxID=56438 RepID=UPI000AF2D54D|nr:TrkA family potassium uptake protein [Couchioplanes caeruleus]
MARNPATSNRIAVLGLGRFGSSLALELMRQGWEVVAIDSSTSVVQNYADRLTHAAIANTTDEQALRQLGVHDFAHAVVGIGTDLEASILTTSLLADLGVPNIWAKAINRQHASILQRVGAHHVVLPEHEMGERVAHLSPGTSSTSSSSRTTTPSSRPAPPRRRSTKPWPTPPCAPSTASR